MPSELCGVRWAVLRWRDPVLIMKMLETVEIGKVIGKVLLLYLPAVLDSTPTALSTIWCVIKSDRPGGCRSSGDNRRVRRSCSPFNRVAPASLVAVL